MSNGSINLMRSFVVSKLTLTSSFIVFWLLDESKWCKKREFQTQIVQQGKHMRNAALKENYFFSSNENLNDHLSAFSLQLFLSLICLWAACRSCCHCWTSLHLSRILTCVFFLAPFCRFYELSASCNYIMGLVSSDRSWSSYSDDVLVYIQLGKAATF